MKKHVKPSIYIVVILTLAVLPLVSLKVFSFTVVHLKIVGLAPGTPASITQPLQALKGRALMAVTPESVNEVLHHSWITCSGVKKVIPDTLQVTLQVRKALVDVGGAWLDREGCPASPLLSQPPPLMLTGEVDAGSPGRLIDMVNAVPDLVASFPIIRVKTSHHWVLSDDSGHALHVDPFTPDRLKNQWVAAQSRMVDLSPGEGMDLRFRSTIIIKAESNGGNHVHLARRR